MSLKVVPITQRAAKAWIDLHHRHLSAPLGDVIRAAVEDAGEIVGVATAGRPSARRLDDGKTIEITRVAVAPGHPNACSMLYGALRRAAKALGWSRVVTYTLDSEHGASLRASGFRLAASTRGGEWDRPSRSRGQAEQACAKTRWEWP